MSDADGQSPGHGFPPPGGSFPPPGSDPTPPTHQPYPTYPGHQGDPRAAPGPPPGWRPPPGMMGSAHKPGAIALKPLTLGEIYDGAFKIIRYNPRATVGSAVLVSSVAMIIPIVVTAIFTLAVGFSFDTTTGSSVSSSGDVSSGEVAGLVGSMGALILGSVLQSLGMILVAGMVTVVVDAAAVGRRLTLTEAWAATRGKRWRLVGLATLLGLVSFLIVAAYVAVWVLVAVTAPWEVVLVFGILTVPVFLAFLMWFWIRVYYLPAAALMLEPVGVLGAIGRGWALTRKAFWRTFGIALLSFVLAQVIGSVVATPFVIGGELVLFGVGDEYAMLGLVVSQALATVVTSAFVGPFLTAVTALQYVDARIRKEAFDVELMTRAGILPS